MQVLQLNGPRVTVCVCAAASPSPTSTPRFGFVIARSTWKRFGELRLMQQDILGMI
jgi:hypothetical protein